MKIFQFIIIFIVLLFSVNFVNAQESIVNVRGRVLLQADVQMAWYVNPEKKLRYRLGNSVDAFKLIQDLGLGISNKDFDSFDNVAREDLAGKILIKVEDSGKAYYVNPPDLKIHFLGKPKNALLIMRELGVIIKESDLEKIEIFNNGNSYNIQLVSQSNNEEGYILDDLEENAQKSITTSEKEFYTNGIYLTSTTFKRLNIDSFIEQNKNSPLNTVVVDVRGFGFLTIKENKVENTEIIEKIQKLKQAGFYFIARVVALKNNELARISPLKTKYGDVWNGVWVDGSTEVIKEYYLEIVTRLAKIGIDEIQLDYIRFPTEYFSRQTPSTKSERTKIITDLVRIMYEKAQDEGIKLSADVFGVLAWNVESDVLRLGQDIKELIKYVDYLSPMIYPSHFGEGFGGFVNGNNPYLTIKESMEEFIELVGADNKEKLRPWLQGFVYKAPNFSSEYIYAQVKALKDLDIDDFLIWNASNKYTMTYEMFSNL